MASIGKIRNVSINSRTGDAFKVEVIGVDDIKKVMQKASWDSSRRMKIGLTKAALLLQRMSQKIVPILTSTLKDSAGTDVIGEGWDADALVFYTALYAVYVHEQTQNQHKKGKQAKFLETPMRENRRELLNVIAGL